MRAASTKLSVIYTSVRSPSRLVQAEQYPKCKFTAVSNSRTQKQFIEGQAAAAGLKNVTVITADMNDFDAPGEFDRVISVEMFEHMKNYGVWRLALLTRLLACLFACCGRHCDANGAGAHQS